MQLTDEICATFLHAIENEKLLEDTPLLQDVFERACLEFIEVDDSLSDYDEDDYDLMV